FFNTELISFFEERNLKLKVERQMRVFPESARSSGILDVLKKELEKNKVNISFKSKVTGLAVSGAKAKGLFLEGVKKIEEADRVIMACGGASYSFTGSDGSGINIAERLGHKIIPLRAGLVSLDVKERFPKVLEGLTLRNIKLNFSAANKQIPTEVGEMIFTSSGISGPLVITYSGRIIDLLGQGERVFVSIDLKPGLTMEQLDNRLLREFKSNAQKSIKNILKELLPLRLIKVFVAALAIDPLKKCSQITLKERKDIISLLKGFKMEVSSGRPIEEAMITRGGISLKEINPRTMESRLVRGLYFCGEMIDVDADTGGFNLQAAFSTGYLAGESAST
ncbi:MAG: aminoacetone oxidase family FAD-binding enzyme, partial [Candidatus Omnitrophota bacterium]